MLRLVDRCNDSTGVGLFFKLLFVCDFEEVLAIYIDCNASPTHSGDFAELSL